MIFNKEPVLALWEILKSLESKTLKIFKEYMDEDPNDSPSSFVVIKSEPTDNPRKFGEGKTIIRQTESQLDLISKGAAKTKKNIHNVNKQRIKDLLDEQGIPYTKVDLAYDKDSKQSESVFMIKVSYYE